MNIMIIFQILYDAYKNTKNLYRSIAGNNIKIDVTENEKSELNKKHWNIYKLIELNSDLFIPKLPIHSPSWVPKFIKKILFGSNCKYLPDSIKDEDKICIIYINGIMSNRDVVEVNRGELKKIFNRPIDVIHNVTDSFIMDILECLIGKETNDLTEASTITLYTVSKKLLDININKVILICHSQGTIIVSKVLQSLAKLGLDKEYYLKKLEIYAFANCASKMNYIVHNYPYMEHFANEDDFVARLGCNCSDEMKKYISIDGNVFIKENKSGHMFNSHYIDNFSNDYPTSKLNKYIK
tara:strand:- start:34 stop:921 length:888 start_codon:yes stop_codon:yes gene_type:complete